MAAHAAVTSADEDSACVAIIPAFNEAGRVGSMVELARASALFTEVLVIDDGSSDATAEEAARAGARVISHGANRGKSQALKTAFDATTAPFLCFLDADLLNVSVEHLQSLVRPVLQGVEQATLGVFEGGRLLTGMAQKIAPMISGQRCLRRELLISFTDWGSGYGIETAINAHLLAIGVQQRIVYWKGAAQLMKEEKWGLLAGTRRRIKMMYQVVVAWLRSKFSRRRQA
jgi:hypothetical protein